EEKDGALTGTVSRKGHEIMRVEGSIGRTLHKPEPGIGQWATNMRSMLGFLPAHLLMFHPQETIHQVNAMNLEVTLTSSDIDPIGIASGPARSGSIRTCDISGGMTPPPLRVWPIGSGFQLKQMPLRVY